MIMENASNQSNLSRLIYFLESLLASTHEGKAQVEAYSHEAQILLQGWILPEAISDEITCLCAQVQKHQLTAFLEKVEKAVKYSQYIREGRSDIANPWEGETEINSSNGTVKKMNEGPRNGPAGNREKGNKGRFISSSSRKSDGNTSSKCSKANVKTNEQERHVPTCPLHGSSEDSLKARSIKTVGLAEALDVMGIPPDLVTILKSVHHFINRLRTTNMKNRAESSFLRHLNTLNESRWGKFPSHNLPEKFEVLPINSCHRKIFMFEDNNSTSAQTRNYLPLIGIWNPAIYNIVPNGALCVQYQSEEIWNLLQLRIQQLQLSQAEWQVCDILSRDPLLMDPDLQRSAAPFFLKAATALSRLTVLNLPVLVKTYHC